MPWASKHLDWLINTKQTLKSVDGKTIEVFEFRPTCDAKILSAWAKHFRNHYCLDTEIDALKPPKFTRSEFLIKLKFPDSTTGLGPPVRAGDFSEVLLMDYLQYFLGFWVPRTRFSYKNIPNESTKGCDIVGFKFFNKERFSIKDTLVLLETKAQFTGSSSKPKLQEAVDDSAKDQRRKAESLNAIKQRFYDKQMLDDCKKVERFQNFEDHPYEEKYGAAALFCTSVYDAGEVSKTNTVDHPNQSLLFLVVIHGANMMKIVHDLYKRAADEA